MKQLLLILTALACTVTVAASSEPLPSSHAQPVAAQATSTQGGPYYLALGDSLTAGTQPDLSHIPGLAHLFFQTLRAHDAVKQMLNLACTGESTDTFINGTCPVGDPPNSYDGYFGTSTQFTAALAFIRAHPGRVRYITIDLGINDVYFPNGPPGTVWCQLAAAGAIAAFHQVDTNLRTIFSRLHAALQRTGTIIVFNYYDPWQNMCAHSPASEVSSVATLNRHIASAAAAFHIRVADVYSAFHGKTTPNPWLCALTHMCSEGDLHPTQAGHALIAAVLAKAAGY